MTTNPFAPDPQPATPPVNPFMSEALGHRPGGTSSASESTPAAPASGADLSPLLARAREIKAQKQALDDEYAEIRSRLWDAVGRKVGKIPGGASFRKLTAKRRTDLKRLESEFPEAYQATVTLTEPDPDAPGALYL
ncbi:hypothetical protein [Nocardia phage NS-I]|jgi:hypothetical protein|nr:hypothetical protein [Nocardia phage NS-I]